MLALVIDARSSSAKLRPNVIAYWQRLHQCEQPSGWHGGFPTYPGGLGVWYGNWPVVSRALGLGRYPNMAAAPPLVQIAAADYAYRRWHWTWGCFKTVGYPPR